MSDIPNPTPAELEILRLLWRLGPSTVRDLHDAHVEQKPVRYTTVLRLLQNMHRKGLVRRDDSARSHVFESVVPAVEIEVRLIEELAQQAFDGSTSRLVLRALSRTPATDRELAEVERLLEKIDRDEGGR